MAMKFDMIDLGLFTYYLRIKVHQRENDITITQEGHEKKTLKDAGMFDCNSTIIPMDSNIKFSKGKGEEYFDATEYRSLIGRLRYLLQIRLDRSYLVGITSQ